MLRHESNSSRSMRTVLIAALALLLLFCALFNSADAATVQYSVPKALTVTVGETAAIKVSQVGAPEAVVTATYTSLNKRIATVDKAGTVTGVKKGTTTVYVKIGRLTYRTSVKVVAAPPTPTPIPSPTPTPLPTPVPGMSMIPAGVPGTFISEGNLLELINAERAKSGLNALTLCEELKDAANLRAYEISQSFSHTRPNGTPSIDLIKQVMPKYACRNENIAKRLGSGSTDPAYILNLWMNSEGHRKNIMRPQHTKVAVGVYRGPDGWVYWATLFIGPKW